MTKHIVAFLLCGVFGSFSIIAERIEPFGRFATEEELIMFAYELGLVGILFTLCLMLLISVKGNAAYVWVLGSVLTGMDVVNLFLYDFKITIWHGLALYILGILLTLSIKRYGRKWI